MKGIDVSNWNTITDWQAIRRAGMDFAMIRAGYGRGNYGRAEPQIHKRITEAHAAGLHVGLYWFSYAKNVNEAVQEADEILEIAEQHKGKIDFPIAFDWEYDSDRYAGWGASPDYNDQRTEIAKAFLNRVQSAGYYAINYSNMDYLTYKLNAAELDNFDLWLAATGLVQPSRPCGIWQYSWDGKIPGIIGNVDMDFAYKDYPAIMRQYGLNGFGKNLEETPAEITHTITITCKNEAERAIILEALKKAR